MFWCLKAVRHIWDNFGRGQLTYPHCSRGSSLPVFSSHSFACNWQQYCPSWISEREKWPYRLFHDQTPRKNVAGREDLTRDRPHTRRKRIRPSYRNRHSVLRCVFYLSVYSLACFSSQAISHCGNRVLHPNHCNWIESMWCDSLCRLNFTFKVD